MTASEPVVPSGMKAAAEPLVTCNRIRRPEIATGCPLLRSSPPSISNAAPATGFSVPGRRTKVPSSVHGPMSGGSASWSKSLCTNAVALRVSCTNRPRS